MAKAKQELNETKTAFDESWRELSKLIHETAVEKGFWESENVGEKIALMHSELSEALEAVRMSCGEGLFCMDDKIPEFFGVEAELADCVIRIMDAAVQWGWDVSGAILAKMKYNETRPYKHGKEF